jgi:phosphoglycolate phosphatase-like HAD superfamily hydrolase/uridine kinase
MTGRLIVFDLDGTLHRTETALSPAIRAAMADMGLDPPPDRLINQLYGEPMERFCSELLGSHDPRDCSLFREGVRRHQERTVPASGELYPGTSGMLREITGMGYTAAVCSNSGMHYIDLVLGSLGIGGMVPLRRGIEGDGSKAGRVSGLAAAAGGDLTLVAGDRYHDIAAAVENGFPGIWCSYGYGAPGEGSDAAFTADSPGDIASIAAKSLAAHRVESLLSRVPGPCPCVGISGRDASGKTSFTDFLSRFLRARGHGVLVVHLDDFHNPLETRRKGPDEITAYLENAFDTERLCREVLEPARGTGMLDTTLDVLDLGTDRFDRSVTCRAGPGTVILVEGVLLFRDPVDRHLDVRVFLDVPTDVILGRSDERDGPGAAGRCIAKYIPVHERFDAEYDPAGRSDLVIDNSDPDRPSVKDPTRGSGRPL